MIARWPAPPARLRSSVLAGWTAVMAVLLLNPTDAVAQGTPDLTVIISKAGALPDVPTNTNVAFDVKISNLRPGPATNVLTRVAMPAGFTVSSTQPTPASGITCNVTGTVVGGSTGPAVLCTAPSLAGNSQKGFRISATAPKTITGTSQDFILVAQVDPSNSVVEGGGGNNNNSDNLTTRVVTRADLTVGISGTAIQLAPQLVFVVTVDNDGDREAANLLVRSTLPKDVAFVRVEENQLGSCLQNNTAPNGALNVNCTLSSLPAGAKRHVRIVGRVLGGVPDSVRVTTAVAADPSNTVPERNDTDNTAFLITTLRAPSDLQLTGTAVESDDALILTGPNAKVFELRLSVRNNGPYASRPTTITTGWPATIIAHTDQATHPCFNSCAVPKVNPGQTIAITMTGILLAPFENELVNPPRRVQVTSTADPGQTLFESVVANNKVTLSISVPRQIQF